MSIEPRRRYTSPAVYGRVTPFQRLPAFHACSRELMNCCLSMVPVRDGRAVSVEILIRYRREELRKVRAGSEVGQNPTRHRKLIVAGAPGPYPFGYRPAAVISPAGVASRSRAVTRTSSRRRPI